MGEETINVEALSGVKAQYDTEVKKVLAQKTILAYILQRTAQEFAGMEISEIIPCIEDSPEISTVHLMPGTTEISGMPNESSIPGEGFITYDIRFSAAVPGSGESIRLIINVEAQKDFAPGYEIVTRAVFYCARMISAQKHTEFEKSDYDNIKKVYSIWLCMNTPESIGNAIAEYRLAKKDILGEIPDKPAAYDKISIVIITLNENGKNKDKLTGMLGVLLSAKLGVAEKIRRLDEEYQIKMDYELKKGVNEMCNLSELVAEEAMSKGEAKGEARGRAEGSIEGANRLGKLIVLLMENGEIEAVREVSVNDKVRDEYFKKYHIE